MDSTTHRFIRCPFCNEELVPTDRQTFSGVPIHTCPKIPDPPGWCLLPPRSLRNLVGTERVT